MNYIVDPSWVYWMSVADAIKCVVLVVGGVFGVVSIIGIPIMISDSVWEDVKKWAIPFIALTAVLLLAGVFIPSKKTMITMKVAELATKENITMTAEQLKEIVDYIINAIKELK